MDALLDADPREGTPELDRLELLSILVAAYEADNEPEPHLPTPQAAVRFMAEQKGITATESRSPPGWAEQTVRLLQ